MKIRMSRVPKNSKTIMKEHMSRKNQTLEHQHPFRRDPFSEFIASKLGMAISLVFLALLCDVFLAKPVLNQKGITEVQLINEIMQKTGVISNFENTLRYINASIPTTNTDPVNRPGYVLAEQGAKAKHPVVLVPGFITSGLELWAGEECAKKHYRQKMWGSLPIFLQSFLTDIKCYSRHLALDPLTGGDPANIKLRSAQGFEAADYFFSTYWVWGKVIENLSDVGYDSSNMIMMPYDWRLSFSMLEKRDGYLTKLQMNIEAMRKTTGELVVLTSHSMGSQIVLYFFKWVTTDRKDGGGGGGHDWVEKNIAGFVNIAGPLLGVPKAVPALLSGEMKDTARLIGPMGSMVERVFGRKDRRDLWTTWGSLWEMLPKGGDEIWETSNDFVSKQIDKPGVSEYDSISSLAEEKGVCPTDAPIMRQSPKRPFITFTEDVSTCDKEANFQTDQSTDKDYYNEFQKTERHWSMDDAVAFLKSWGGGYGSKLQGSKSISKPDSQSWNDPTKTSLPYAPSMKIYCLYGVGIDTERAYFYRNPISGNDGSIPESERTFIMDAAVSDPDENIKFGTLSSDGDVSVPLLSLGYLCVDKWKRSHNLNPSGIKVITREYKHKEEFQVNDPMRGGPYSSDHVDILGNVDAATDLIKIATGFQSEITDSIVSDIESISRRIRSNS